MMQALRCGGGRLGRADVVAELVAELARHMRRPDVACSGVEALARSGDPEAVSSLAILLGNAHRFDVLAQVKSDCHC